MRQSTQARGRPQNLRQAMTKPGVSEDAVAGVFRATESDLRMVRCFCDSLHKLIELRALVEEGLSSRAKIELAIGWIRVAAEHHESNVRRRTPHSAQHLPARATFQLHVEHDHTGMGGEDAVDGSLRGLGEANNRHAARLQQAGDPIADQDGVFSKENFDNTGKCFSHAPTVAAALHCSHRQKPKIHPCPC